MMICIRIALLMAFLGAASAHSEESPIKKFDSKDGSSEQVIDLDKTFISINQAIEKQQSSNRLYKLNCPSNNSNQTLLQALPALMFSAEFETAQFDAIKSNLENLKEVAEEMKALKAGSKILAQALAPKIQTMSSVAELEKLIGDNAFIDSITESCRADQKNDFMSCTYIRLLSGSLDLALGYLKEYANDSCLNLSEKIILSAYVGTDYIRINATSSNRDPFEQNYRKPIRKKISEILKKFPIYQGQVYVGTWINPKEIESLRPGQSLNYGGFLSASFNGAFTAFIKNTVLVIKNKTGRNIAPFNPSESEVVFENPNLIIQSIQKDNEGNFWIFCKEQ